MTRLETLLAKDNRDKWPILNIAILTPYDINTPSGVNENADATAVNLQERGHNVTRFAPGKGKIANGLRQRTTGQFTFPLANGGSVSKVGFFSPRWFEAAFRLKYNHDLVHIHDPAAICFPPVATSLILDRDRTANVVTLHASAKNRDWKRNLYSFLLSLGPKQLASRNLHKRITVSMPAHELSNKYFPGDYEILSNPLDVVRFNPDGEQEDYLRKENQTTFLYLARHGENEKRKGLRYLAEAFKNICEHRSDAHLIVAGPGKIDSDSQGFLDQIPDSFKTILRKISAGDLPKVYRSVDVVVTPSDSNESFGYVPAEGMASGRPIISSNIDGYSNAIIGDVGISYEDAQKLFVDKRGELIVHNGAILFEAGHIQQLEDSITFLINNRELRTQLGERGRETMVDNFSVGALTDRLENIYYDVLRGMPDESNLATRLSSLHSFE